MSTLWNPRKPLTQPPHYGRIAAKDKSLRDDTQTAARLAHTQAQFARWEKTSRIGLRAVVTD